jgi:MATE family multidrug resistance protein
LALYLGAWWLTLPLGNAGLWIAILTFFGSRGALQAARYRSLVRATFGRQVLNLATAPP